MQVACGQCRGCRLEQRRQWAMRIVHEASLHEDNCFLTLTYDDAHLPADRSLSKRDLQLFVKRLRKQEAKVDRRFRYFGVGEYGGRTGRPHYHLCMFGFDPGDKRYLASVGDHKVYLSPEVERAWPLGLHQVGSLTEKSARYVAGYVQKKVHRAPGRATVDVVDRDSGQVFAVTPEFAQMSRRPGIGRGWIERYRDEVVAGCEVVSEGRPTRAPSYYDRIIGEVDPGALEEVKRERRRNVRRSDSTPERLAVREKVAAARENLHARTVL